MKRLYKNYKYYFNIVSRFRDGALKAECGLFFKVSQIKSGRLLFGLKKFAAKKLLNTLFNPVLVANIF